MEHKAQGASTHTRRRLSDDEATAWAVAKSAMETERASLRIREREAQTMLFIAEELLDDAKRKAEEADRVLMIAALLGAMVGFILLFLLMMALG